MKHILVKILLLVVLASSAWTSLPATEYDFRRVKWGMTKDDVKAAEPGKVQIDNKDGIAFDARVAGMEAYVFYYFLRDKRLHSAAYDFKETH